MRNKKGAALIESVLIMVLLFGLTQFIFSNMENTWIESMVNAPMNHIKGMARSGVWENFENNSDIDSHPNIFERHIMSKGKDID